MRSVSTNPHDRHLREFSQQPGKKCRNFLGFIHGGDQDYWIINGDFSIEQHSQGTSDGPFVNWFLDNGDVEVGMQILYERITIELGKSKHGMDGLHTSAPMSVKRSAEVDRTNAPLTTKHVHCAIVPQAQLGTSAAVRKRHQLVPSAVRQAVFCDVRSPPRHIDPVHPVFR